MRATGGQSYAESYAEMRNHGDICVMMARLHNKDHSTALAKLKQDILAV